MDTYEEFSKLPVPKYYQVYLALKEQIDRGEYSTETAIPSERTLVELFHVSRITIVKAIDLLEQEGLIDRRQGLGNFVIPRQQTLPNKIYNLAFVTPDKLQGGYTASILTGVMKAAAAQFFQIQVIGAQIDQAKEILSEELCCGDVDGVILYPGENGSRDWVKELVAESVPLVLIDRFYPDIPCDSVVFNDEETAYELTKGLFVKGMRRIAFLPHLEVTPTSVINRLKGFQRAHLEFGVPLDEDLMWFDVYNHLKLGIGLMQDDSTELLRDHIVQFQPEAVFAVNHQVFEKFYFDLMTLKNRQLSAQINETRNIVSPQTSYDIAQVGICDRVVNFVNPKFQKTAFQDGEELGDVAFHLLQRRVMGKLKNNLPIQEMVRMHLERESGL